MADSANTVDVELSPKGTKVQTGIAAAVGVLGVLMKAGFVGASVSNPILLGVTIFSSVLPALFKKKAKAVIVPAPVASRLMESVQPEQTIVVATAAPPGPVNLIGAFLLQAASILTALLAMFTALPLDLIPEKWNRWVLLGTAGLSALLPALQRVGQLFSDIH